MKPLPRPRSGTFNVFLIAGEESGDLLGANLMAALVERLGPGVRFTGIGGRRMAALGLASLFPMEELALHGLSSVVRNLPRLRRRLHQAVAAVVAARPDALVLVDVPGFNLRVARRVRRQLPDVAIVDYVSPSVWAWAPGRAPRMAAFVDRVLAILPFEPEVHRELGGPQCVYVGHPLIERLAVLRPAQGERPALGEVDRPRLLVLPGSRRSEIRRLMEPFGETVALVVEALGPVDVVLPAVPHLADEIRRRAAFWPVRPTIVEGEDEKLAAFRRAHAALAASGTVTLELALSGVPMVVAYRVEPVLKPLKRFLRVRSIVLANLVLGTNAVPEFLDHASTPRRLAEALIPLLGDTAARRAQLAAFRQLDDRMQLPSGTPSAAAAEAVIDAVADERKRHAAVDRVP
jgi:lipid-A-disaccharide synthase